MTVTYSCPRCDASYGIDELNHLGEPAHCMKCGAIISLDHGTREEASSSSTDLDSGTSPTDESFPPTIGRFSLIRRLGKGGMGTVYLAYDPQLNRPVALKVPHPEQAVQPAARDRFLREARAAARFRHSNFCPIHEIGEADGFLFLAMAYIEGQTLEHSIQRGQPWEPRKAADVVHKLALALAVAHRSRIIHRDLKPANIMVDDRGDLVLMDFGLARLIDGDDTRLTPSGAVLGTPAYMSPEQAEADLKAIGPRSDVYSLGVIFYELLAGRRPFEGSSTRILAQILMTDPQPPSSHQPAIDPALESICLKAIARKPEDRYVSMDDLAEAIRRWLENPPPSSPEKAGHAPEEEGFRPSPRGETGRIDRPR